MIEIIKRMDQYQPYLMMLFTSMKYGNENDKNNYQFMSIILIFLLTYITKLIPDNIITKIIDLCYDKNNKIIVHIPSIESPIIRSNSTTPQYKILYSTEFLAITYYLNKYHSNDFNTITQDIKNNKDLDIRYYDDDNLKDDSYIMLPINNNNILVDKKHNIYCDFNLQKNEDEDKNDKNNKDVKYKKSIKQYIISLWIKKSNMVSNTKLSISDINNFINACVEEYEKSKNKEGDTKLYIYEYINSEKVEDKVNLNFNDDVNESSKKFNNIFFEEKDKLLKYIHPFIYDPIQKTNIGSPKYERCGIAFKAGILFHGSPGCGKTSTIKAILNHTNRHGIVINLNNVKSCEELEALFRLKKINGKNISRKEICYILEDFDAINSDFLLSRKSKENKGNKENNKKEDKSEVGQFIKLFESQNPHFNNTDNLNLSCFLNILDGIIELNGVMIIMTTNHPEKIDEALIRPGRIDFKYEFKKCSKKIIIEMLKFIYQLSDKEFSKYIDSLNIKDDILTPAQVNQISFQHDSIEDCINEIILACQDK